MSEKAISFFKRRKEANKELLGLFAQSEHVVIIHYSCESFYERQSATSPRITSIAVRNLKSGFTNSFSIHQMAELKKIDYSKIEDHYDTLEKEMLKRFFDYYQHNQNCFWLHWNMRDINYGFPALKHRFETLGEKPPNINESKLIDLSRLLVDIYGINYISHPRLEKLIEKNNISKRDFLNGEGEAKAFVNKDFIKLHQSTLRKVDILANIAGRAARDELKTNLTWWKYCSKYPRAFFEFIKDNAVVSGLIIIVGLILTIVEFFKK